MTPVWWAGPGADLADSGDVPLAWEVRLDDPGVESLAARAPLRAADLADLAGRPQAAMRTLRRRLARLLLARLASVHPETVAIGRRPGGAPAVLAPTGWHLSVAGQWPWCLLGASRRPIGVDIEPADAPPPPDDALTAAERAGLAGRPPMERLACWTAKEAHAKLFGVAAQAAPEGIATSGEGNVLLAVSPAGRSVCHVRRDGAAVRAVALSSQRQAPFPRSC